MEAAGTPRPLVLPPVVGPQELMRLCAEVRERLEGGGGPVIVCDVRTLGVARAPGIADVEVLARLQLTARRAGGRLRIRHPAPGLRALLLLVGLRFEMEREVEEREPTGRVQERGQPDDPAL